MSELLLSRLLLPAKEKGEGGEGSGCWLVTGVHRLSSWLLLLAVSPGGKEEKKKGGEERGEGRKDGNEERSPLPLAGE